MTRIACPPSGSSTIMASSHTPASTPAEMGMVLSTLPPAMRWNFVLEKLKCSSPAWMDAARENGLFDAARENDPDYGGREPLRMLEAAIGFVQTFAYGDTQTDPVFGALPHTYHVPLFEPSSDMLMAFTRLVDIYLQEEARLQLLRSQGAHAPSIAAHFARLMAGAAVLDLPDCVRRMAQACPEAVSEPVPYMLLGPNAKSTTNNSGVWPTPFGIALMFSRTKCLDAMALHANSKTLPIGIEIHQRMGTHQEALLNRYFHLEDQYCLPSAFAQALKHVLAKPLSDAERQSYVNLAMNAMNEDLPSQHQNLLRPACMAAGLYDIDPALSISKALLFGCEEIIRHLKGSIPWNDIGLTETEKDSPMVHCLMASQMNSRVNEYENAMLAVIELAEADGEIERVLHQFASNDDDGDLWGPVQVEPLIRIMTMGFDRVLVKCLAHGLDPNAPAAPGAWTPQQMADATPTNASTIFRSHTARGVAKSVIDEIEGLMAPSAMDSTAPRP